MRFIILIISLFLLLPSCRKGEVPSSSTDSEQDTNTGENTNPVEVRFNASIKASVDELLSSRVALDALPIREHVGIFGVLANSNGDVENGWKGYTIRDSKQDNLNNAQYRIEEGGKLTQSGLAQYPKGDTSYDGLVFYAYYPYTPTSELPPSRDKINVLLKSSNMSESTDYLVADRVFSKTPTDANYGSVSLTFNHVLSRIMVNISTTFNNATLTDIYISTNASPEGVLYLEDGTCKPNKLYDSPDDARLYYYGSNLSYSLSKEGTIFDFMIYPDIEVYGIYCEIDGVTYQIYNYETAPIKIEPKKGKIVKVNVSYVPMEASFVSSVSQWEEDTDNVMDFEIDQESGEVTPN